MSSVIVTSPEELRALIRAAVDEALAERERTASAVVASDWILPDEAATMLGVSREYLTKMKDVPSHGAGRQRRYRRSELDVYLETRTGKKVA